MSLSSSSSELALPCTQCPPTRSAIEADVSPSSSRHSKLRRLSVNSVVDGEVRELFEIAVNGLIAQIAAVKVEVGSPPLGSARAAQLTASRTWS